MQKLKAWFLPTLIFLFYRVLSWTWRIKLKDHPDAIESLKTNQNFVIAHWHGEILGLLHLVNHYHSVCIVSQSKDGELIAKAIELFGCKTARGSSTRGGVGAVKSIVRSIRDGWRPTIAIDGPKGPYHIPKPGVIEIAKLCRLPIYPLACRVYSGFTFKKSWDKTILPFPFSRIDICLGEPLRSDELESLDLDGAIIKLKLRLEETSAQFE